MSLWWSGDIIQNAQHNPMQCHGTDMELECYQFGNTNNTKLTQIHTDTFDFNFQSAEEILGKTCKVYVDICIGVSITETTH